MPHPIGNQPQEQRIYPGLDYSLHPCEILSIGNRAYPATIRAMAQSFSAVNIHLVFATKDRRPTLRDTPTRLALHAQLGAISRQLGCPPILVGGVEDHVHVLAQLGRAISLADWVKELKRVSAAWLKTRDGCMADFQWQGGYASFSVSESNLDQVKRYIANQEEHHQKAGFQEELRALLERHQIKWDERYVWS